MKIRKILIICIIVFAVAAVLYFTLISPAMASAGELSVKTGTVARQDIKSTISANGIIEEINKQDMYYNTPLKVKKLLVKKDDKVTTGQKLVEFDMDSMNSDLTKLKLDKEIQLLTLKKIQQTEQTNKRRLEQAKNEYESNKVLYDDGAVSKSVLDNSEKAYKDAQIDMSVDLSTQQIQLKLKNLAISDMEKKIAQIEKSSTSPMNGVVKALNISEGVYVSTVSPAFTISDISNLQITADVKELDSKNIRTGQKVNITGDGIAENLNITGTVSAISTAAEKMNSSSGQETVVGITVTIDKTDAGLKPGLTVTCKVITDSSKNAVVAKYSMINNKSDNSNTVFLFSKDGTAKEVAVKTGITSDLSIEVVEGLTGGEEVIVNAPKTLKNGMKIKRDTSTETSGLPGGFMGGGGPGGF